MKTNVLIFLESPLQLINSTEYINQRKRSEPCHFIFLKDSGRKGSNYQQMLFLLDLYQIENYSVININSLANFYSKLLVSFSFVLKCLKFCRVKEIVIGDMRSSHLQLVNLIFRPERLVALDDGNATLNPFKKDNFINKIFWKVFLRTKKVWFFTIYGDLLEEINIIKNDYSFARQKFKAKSEAKSSYIVGTTLVEVQIMNDDQYMSLLRKLFTNEPDSIYLSHRYESIDKLERIKKEFHCRVEKKDFPLEIELLTGRIQPKLFLGTVSSFFDNLNLIRPDLQVLIAKVENLDLLEEHSIKRIGSAYSVYDKSGYTFV